MSKDVAQTGQLKFLAYSGYEPARTLTVENVAPALGRPRIGPQIVAATDWEGREDAQIPPHGVVSELFGFIIKIEFEEVSAVAEN